MAAAGIDVDGLAQLRGSVAAAVHELTGLTGAHTEAGQLLAARGATDAPRRTGQLADSVAAEVVAARLTVTASAPYAGYVHARNPWLARDLDALKSDLIDIYAAAVASTVATIEGA